ncbi:unnamed protein product [Rotaria socialis]|uniref:Uncharacterized protein n=1 Tax=Rotaria socialis TaxID=392032 RepID=A0A817MWU0_9BILA|nr:unnamed protein product [Rotaria socialis]CAF4868475.1 unnamed protein product [Rotaria socialis]
MPKLLRRRPHSRNAQISLRRSRLLDKAFDHSNESSTESDEEEMKMNEYSFDMSRNFNDISDIFEICENNRGGKRIEKFYEGFPELELEAKLFAIERSLNKSADFIVWDLANFVDQKYYELTNTTKDKNANFVQSIQLYHLDLRHWGFRFDSNSERPYFKGHERPEIITHCETLIKYFLEKKDHFYTISNDENPL